MSSLNSCHTFSVLTLSLAAKGTFKCSTNINKTLLVSFGLYNKGQRKKSEILSKTGRFAQAMKLIQETAKLLPALENLSIDINHVHDRKQLKTSGKSSPTNLSFLYNTVVTSNLIVFPPPLRIHNSHLLHNPLLYCRYFSTKDNYDLLICIRNLVEDAQIIISSKICTEDAYPSPTEVFRIQSRICFSQA